MTEQDKNKIIADALSDVDQSKVDSYKEVADYLRNRIRGTDFEYEMLNDKQGMDTKNYVVQDDDALVERCNELEHLLKCIWEDAQADYEDGKGKCSVSSELIEKIKKCVEEQ